ncbi:MAG: Crp/Fnr family transcriptional regulator [Tistlia sp.]|uniref:Crp/Fnr family transcriptional regulator n=1 Tax=Tistlia sp. TaxID=3057121 RepID=UPI0034A5D638
MPRYLIRKLEQVALLSPEDRRLIEELAHRRTFRLAAGEELAAEGDRPAAPRLFLEGWACRSKSFADGRRQIVGLLLPGDFFDLNLDLLQAMDHSVAAVTPVLLAEIRRDALEGLAERRPALARALAWDTLVQASIQREWTLNVGRRTALERVAHLLCEIFRRLEAVGLTEGAACELPLNQTELADATGLSVVHVNRVLRRLRIAGLLRLRGRQMELPDLPALNRLALFSPGYLHLARPKPEASIR